MNEIVENMPEDSYQVELAQKYKKAKTSLEKTKKDSINAITDMIHLGQHLELIKKHLGTRKYLDMLQSMDIKITESVIRCAEKCHTQHKRGKPVDANQLTLAFCADDHIQAKGIEQKKRPKTQRWIRSAAQTASNFRQETETRPINKWSEDEKQHAILTLKPLMKIWKELQE